jgi:hypothetical protein
MRRVDDEYQGVLVCGQGLMRNETGNGYLPNRNMVARILAASQLINDINKTQEKPVSLILGGGDVFNTGTPISEYYEKFAEERFQVDPRTIRKIDALETVGEVKGAERLVGGKLVIVTNDWHVVALELARRYGHNFYPVESVEENKDLINQLLTKPRHSEKLIQLFGQLAIKAGAEELYQRLAQASIRQRATYIAANTPLPF